MLKLDPFSESVLFQCDHCRRVGELFTDLVADDGYFYCWNCLALFKNSTLKKPAAPTQAVL